VVLRRCNSKKPKVTSQHQKKVVSLWACPLCTRLVTSDKSVCDVCTSDREAIRSADPAPTAAANDLASILGSALIKKNGVPVGTDQLTGKVVCLYFSAHWCAPCRSFTPQLASIYAGAVAAGKPIEIIFVSADRDVDAFNSYFASMPWLAVKFTDDALRKQLNEQHHITSIPSLIVLDSHGCVLSKDGRGDIIRMGDGAITQWIEKSASH
jgi:nucleoredoxin